MNQFYAYMARLRLIRRWSLMRNTQSENDAEHSLQVAMIAHAIAWIGKIRYGKTVDPEHVMTLAVYHDASEVITGDLPTPVKYYRNELKKAYHEVESLAVNRLCTMLPEDLREPMHACMTERDTAAWTIVKAADRISAYVKCLEEQRAGNHEFDAAAETILQSIRQYDAPEIRDFMEEMVPPFSWTLDALNQPEVSE